MENKKLKFDLTSELKFGEKSDDRFAIGQIMVAYTGDNRNLSSISKEALENGKIAGIPVVANFISDKNDFGGHDVKVITTDDGVELYSACVPFGFVPESANQWFTEEVVNGETKQCFWTDVILWKRSYGFDKIAKSKSIHHSMEINATEYILREDGIYQIDKLKFEALCLLGEDVEPCFENSRLEVNFSLDSSAFKEMLSEYTELQKGENMNDNEPIVTEPIVDPVEPTADPEPTPEPSVEPETQNESSVEPEGMVEPEPTPESIESEEPVSEPESVDYELMYNELKANFDTLSAEIEELRKFKADAELAIREKAEAEIFAKFEKLGTIDAFATLKENSKNYSLEDLEDKCYAIAGRYGINLNDETKVDSEPVSTKFSVIPDANTNNSPYGNLFAEYGNR